VLVSVELGSSFGGKGSRLDGQESFVSAMSCPPQGSRIASASDDDATRVWGLFSGRCTLRFLTHIRSISSVCFSPDGFSIASGSYDRSTRSHQAAMDISCREAEEDEFWLSQSLFGPYVLFQWLESFKCFRRWLHSSVQIHAS
jgi:WD40 repeat protein